MLLVCVPLTVIFSETIFCAILYVIALYTGTDLSTNFHFLSDCLLSLTSVQIVSSFFFPLGSCSLPEFLAPAVTFSELPLFFPDSQQKAESQRQPLQRVHSVGSNRWQTGLPEVRFRGQSWQERRLSSFVCTRCYIYGLRRAVMLFYLLNVNIRQGFK